MGAQPTDHMLMALRTSWLFYIELGCPNGGEAPAWRRAYQRDLRGPLKPARSQASRAGVSQPRTHHPQYHRPFAPALYPHPYTHSTVSVPYCTPAAFLTCRSLRTPRYLPSRRDCSKSRSYGLVLVRPLCVRAWWLHACMADLCVRMVGLWFRTGRRCLRVCAYCVRRAVLCARVCVFCVCCVRGVSDVCAMCVRCVQASHQRRSRS